MQWKMRLTKFCLFVVLLFLWSVVFKPLRTVLPVLTDLSARRTESPSAAPSLRLPVSNFYLLELSGQIL